MASDLFHRLTSLIQRDEAKILESWLREQQAASTMRGDLITDDQLRAQSRTFLQSLREGMQGGDGDLSSPSWGEMRSFLSDLSRQRARMGFAPSETARFVFSLKQPLFETARTAFTDNAAALADALWQVTTLLDNLGLLTTEAHMQAREEVIQRQQNEMLELSTPVVQLWDGVLALPLIGTLDSARTQTVMEALLQRIVDTSSEMAILDITGVPMVDTLTAQHILKTVTATRLMGAECIISGVRPQIAQTIVHLGVDLGDVVTKATLASALQYAFQKRNLVVKKTASANT